jgi:hypothetical protein
MAPTDELLSVAIPPIFTLTGRDHYISLHANNPSPALI